MASRAGRFVSITGGASEASMALSRVEKGRKSEWALIMELASRIEASRSRCLQWYIEDPIDVLGGFTAAELVAMGNAREVLGFLYFTSWSERRQGVAC